MLKRFCLIGVVSVFLTGSLPIHAIAQEYPVLLKGADLTKVVPTSFYFEGQSAPTQMRNAAAALMGAKRYVIAGLVDTSGYSSEVRAKYEGFLITDSRVVVGGKEIAAGAYGFGFSSDGKFNIFDVGGSLLMSVSGPSDSKLLRPRPLMMVKSSDGVRLYSRRSYVVITGG